MKKNLKRVSALFCAAALTTTMVMPKLAVNAEEASTETLAYLTFADTAYGVQYWNDGKDYAPVVATTAEVTGDGQYTVGLDFTGVEGGVAPDIQFLDVEISNGEATYVDSFMTIDSVKVNGEEVECGPTYTSSDDGVATRTNLYNPWVETVEKGRTADGILGNATATPVDGEAMSDITSIEVTFTLGAGVAFDATAGAAEPTELPAEGTPAYLTFADTAWGVQYWNDGNDYAPVVHNDATVTGYGQYTVSLDFTGVEGGVAPDMQFLDVEVAGGESYFPNSYMQIDEVKVNGEAVEVGTTYTSSDDDVATRTNLYNPWVESVDKGRTAEGVALTDATAVPVAGDTMTDISNIEVTFTLMEGEAVAADDAAADNDAATATEFNAFMMFADGSETWESYDQGVGTEATVTGDGIYEVSLTAEQCGAAGKANPDEAGCVFLVDIVGLGQYMEDNGLLTQGDDEKWTVTDAAAKVAIFVDGVRVNSKSDNIVLGDIEENGNLRIDLFNAFDGAGTAENPVVMPSALTAESEIKVVFSLTGTGLNSDADTDLEAYLGTSTDTASDDAAAADTEAADTEEESAGLSTGVIVAIVVVVVVVIAAIAVVVLKKKKN